MSTRRPLAPRLVAGAFALTLVAAACGDDGDGDTSEPPATTADGAADVGSPTDSVDDTGADAASPEDTNPDDTNPDDTTLAATTDDESPTDTDGTAATDGTDMRLVNMDSSHYTWRDPETILVWVNDYLLVKDDVSLATRVLWRAPNGHQSYLPGNKWIVTDTYPLGSKREQILYLYHVASGRIVPLGFFARTCQ